MTFLHGSADRFAHVLVRELIRKRHEYVKDEIRPVLSRHHAEIVQAEHGIDVSQKLHRFLAQLRQPLVFRIHGVHVDDGEAAELVVQLAHRAVDHLVQLINIPLAVHLRVEGDMAAAGAVVVNDEIVDGENFRV